MDNKYTALPSFFMLRAGELKVTIDCGCTLRNQVNTVFNYCPLHDAAPALLAALEDAPSPPLGANPKFPRAYIIWFRRARAAIKKAKKETT